MPTRPTKRERKEEIRRRRLDEMRRKQIRARKRRIFALVTLVVLIVAAIATAAVARAVRSAQIAAARREAAAAGCDVPRQFPSEGRTHVPVGKTVQYKTDPPTSGPHYNQPTPPTSQGSRPRTDLVAPTTTGFHAAPIANEVEVHNLEHGHIIIQYQPNALSNAVIEKLKTLATKNPQWVIVAPRENQTAKLALTAWTIKQACANPNDKVVRVAKDFIARFKDHGPESIPGSLVPNQGGAGPGGIPGQPGGVAGQPGGAPGRPGGVAGQPGGRIVPRGQPGSGRVAPGGGPAPVTKK